MWIKDNCPAIYKKAKRILLMEDYIIYMLTGAAQIDYSLAARTMAFDIRSKCWSDEILLPLILTRRSCLAGSGRNTGWASVPKSKGNAWV